MFIYQGNNFDCGYASLKMLLANVHNDKNYLYLSNEKKDESYSLSDLVDIGKKYGVNLIGKEMDYEFFLSKLKQKKKFLVVIETNTNEKHMVFIKGLLFNKYLRVYDPDKGKRLIDIVNFKKLYLGQVLEFDDTSFVKTKCPIKKQEIVPLKNRLLVYGLSFLSMTSIILVVSLIAYNIDFIFIGLGLFCYLLAELALRFCLHNYSKKFDEKYFPKLRETTVDQIRPRAELLQNTKKSIFSLPVNLIINLIFIIAISVVFFINGKEYLIVLVACFIFAVLIEMINRSSTKKKIKEINAEEDKLLSGRPIELNNFLNKTYSVAGILSLQNLELLAIAIFGGIYLMITTNNTGLNFVLFYGVAIYLAIERLMSILSTIDQSDENEKNEARFRDTFL